MDCLTFSSLWYGWWMLQVLLTTRVVTVSHLILQLLPATTFSISFVICNIYLGLNNGYIIVRWVTDSMYIITPYIVIVFTSYFTLAIMHSSHTFCNTSIISSLKISKNRAFLFFWFLNSFWIQFKMIVFLILAILGELSILLHNTQPIWSLEPLQIVQVSSLFDY